MKFSFLLLLTSNAILATSAAFKYPQLRIKEIGPLFEFIPFDPTTDILGLDQTSFGEAVSYFEREFEAVYQTKVTPADAPCPKRSKHRICKFFLVNAAKWEDHRGFLVMLDLYRTYESEVKKIANENSDQGTLALLLEYKEEILLTTAAKGSVLRVEMLLALGKWDASDFPKLMDKAAAEGLSWVVDILLQDDRVDEGIESLTKNINIDTTLPDLVGPHLLEYTKRKIGTSADDQETANEMWWDAMVPGSKNPLRFLALLDKADASWHKDALEWCQGTYEEENLFEEAILLAYGKLEGSTCKKRRLSNSQR